MSYHLPKSSSPTFSKLNKLDVLNENYNAEEANKIETKSSRFKLVNIVNKLRIDYIFFNNYFVGKRKTASKIVKFNKPASFCKAKQISRVVNS